MAAKASISRSYAPSQCSLVPSRLPTKPPSGMSGVPSGSTPFPGAADAGTDLGTDEGGDDGEEDGGALFSSASSRTENLAVSRHVSTPSSRKKFLRTRSPRKGAAPKTKLDTSPLMVPPSEMRAVHCVLTLPANGTVTVADQEGDPVADTIPS